MTDERLAEIRLWVDLHSSCPGDAYDLLLAEVDRLRAADAETVAVLAKLVGAIDAEHRDPVRATTVADSNRALIAARALLERKAGR